MIGNLGRKDRDGRQVRIEYRGRNLRASRTGGVALRQEVRAGRIGLTANTSKGLRLSSALGPGTQVAAQNGRFVLRGVYGSGPVRFNLSKSGLSASLASDVGRLNLTHPARSSAKVFGVQVRGKKAAWMNLGAMFASAVVVAVKLVVLAVIVLVRGGVWLGGAMAVAVQRLVARWRLWRKERAFEALMDTVRARATPIGPGDVRTVPDGDAAQMGRLAELLARNGGAAGSSDGASGSGDAVSDDDVLDDLAEAWRVAGALFAGKAAAEIVETVLALDEGCVAAGGRTVAQEEMLGVIAEAGGVRVVATGEASLS
jgi:hypothetical protein